MCTRLFSFAILFSLFVQPCLAATAADSLATHAVDSLTASAPAADLELAGATGLVMRMLLSLTVVIALIWGATRLLRRLSGDGASNSSKSHVRVLDRTYIAPKKAVYVINIGNRSLALGVTDSQISTLAELDNAETLAAYPGKKTGGSATPFAGLLKEVRNKFSSDQTAGEEI